MDSDKITVKDIMKKDVITVFNFTKLDEAARLMTGNDIGCLIVVKNNNIVGIITERDFVRGIGNNIDLINSTVEDIMSSQLTSIAPGLSIEQAAKKMSDLKIRRLPIVEDLNLIGIVTERDIIKVTPELIFISRSLKDIGYMDDFQEHRTENGYCEDCFAFSHHLNIMDGKILCGECGEC